MKRLIPIPFLISMSLLACQADQNSHPPPDETPPGVELPPGCDHYVTPSEDDQEAVQTVLIEALPSDTVCLGEGDFHFQTELSISVEGLILKGAGREATTLNFDAQDLGANGIHITSDGVTVEGFLVVDTPGDGIRATAVEGITFRNVAVVWTAVASGDNGAYGFYPVESTDVLVEGCLVQGSSDAGIYVGQSRRILVQNNEATGNVGGIQIENSFEAEVVDNHAHDNSAGILIFSLPELPQKGGERTKVHRNLIENNNLENFGKPGSIVSHVPPGTGVIILSCDDNEVTDNDIRGNDSTGIVVSSYLDGIFGLYEDDEFDAFPQGNYLHGNRYADNGNNPQEIFALLELEAPAPEILFDGCQSPEPGAQNCINEAEEVRFLDLDLCNEITNQPTDLSPYDCTYEPLPAQGI
jgi:parallel beta-helix repeat protein